VARIDHTEALAQRFALIRQVPLASVESLKNIRGRVEESLDATPSLGLWTSVKPMHGIAEQADIAHRRDVETTAGA
jgi:hypothetical protein